MFTLLVPEISVKSVANKIPVLGQVGYSLICEVIGVKTLDLNITYKWSMSNGTDFETQSEIDENSDTLCFNSLRYSDAGLYMCQLVGINTDYLNGTISISDSLNLTIQSKKSHATKCRTVVHTRLTKTIIIAYL